MQANARPGITKERSTFAKELFIGIITTIIGTVLGVWLEYSFNVTDYMPSSKAQIVSIEPVDGSVRPLPLQEEIVVNYVTKRKDETVRVLLNGIDITREATEHSQGRMVFRGTSCTSIANLTPTVHYLSAEIVNGNDRVVASKTASLTTTFQDLFDNFDPRVWREQSGQWTANGGYLTGSPQEGAATASLLSVGEYLHDIRIELWAIIDENSVGGISVLFNNIYEVIFGDGDTHTIRLKRGRETLATEKTLHLRSGHPHFIVIERVNGRIRVMLDQRELITYLDYQDPPGEFGNIGLRVWKSTVSFDSIKVWSPKSQ